MRKLLVLFISCILMLSACTKDIRIQGFVRTSGGTAIQDAFVTIQRANLAYETTTDHTGYYVFGNVSVGTWELAVSKEGYDPQSETFSVSGGSSGNIYHKNFELKIPLKPQ